MKVAVAIITDADNKVLITQRPSSASHAFFWEFPGGKLEENELPKVALIREIKEELDLDVLASQYLGEVHHQYEKHEVCLLIYHVFQYQNTPRCCEGQLNMRWIHLDEISQFSFPAANLKILQIIQEKLPFLLSSGFN